MHREDTRWAWPPPPHPARTPRYLPMWFPPRPPPGYLPMWGAPGPSGLGALHWLHSLRHEKFMFSHALRRKIRKKNPKIKKKRAMRSSAPPGCPLSSPSSQTHGLGHFQSPARCWPPPPLGKPPRLPPPEPLLPPPKPPRPMGPGKGGFLGFFGVKKRDFGDARTLPRHPHPGSPYLLGRGRPGRPLRRG